MGMKKLWVHSANWETEVIVDSEIFDDVFLEACTRVLEQNIKVNNTIVAPFMETRLKNRKKMYIFNTYKILINAGQYVYAENLRTNFKKQTQIDLKYEPIKA